MASCDMRSESERPAATQGVALSRAIFRSSLRSSIDTRVESSGLSSHWRIALPMAGLSFMMPRATAAENNAASAELADSSSRVRRPGRADTTVQAGFSQNVSDMRAPFSLGRRIENVLSPGLR